MLLVGSVLYDLSESLVHIVGQMSSYFPLLKGQLDDKALKRFFQLVLVVCTFPKHDLAQR